MLAFDRAVLDSRLHRNDGSGAISGCPIRDNYYYVPAAVAIADYHR